MATGRKGPAAPSTRRKRASGPPDDGGDDGDDGGTFAGGGPPDDLVAVVRGLAAAVAEHGLTELIVDTPDVTFTLRRGGTSATAQPDLQPMPMHAMPMHAMPMQQMPMSAPTMQSMPSIQIPPMAAGPGAGASGIIQIPPPAPPEEKVHIVTSPFVGTFYRRPNPDAAEYVKINDKVSKGAVLCLVEAMKMMNEIESDVGGTVVGVLAEDGAPVEYGQPLFKIV